MLIISINLSKMSTNSFSLAIITTTLQTRKLNHRDVIQNLNGRTRDPNSVGQTNPILSTDTSYLGSGLKN